MPAQKGGVTKEDLKISRQRLSISSCHLEDVITQVKQVAEGVANVNENR
jgi:hypothetical protein